jgi:hypothetical protein
MTIGDDLRTSARNCRIAATTTTNKGTSDLLRKMAAEYDAKAEKADAEDAQSERR